MSTTPGVGTDLGSFGRIEIDPRVRGEKEEQM